MSTNFQCEYCNYYYASRNAYAQHVGRCIKTVICSSTEESGEDVSSVNEMLLDNEDFSHIDEFQIIQEENLPSVSEVSYKFENDQDYEGDISFSGRSSNMEECENFDEILPASLRSCENFLSASLRSYNEPEEEPEEEKSYGEQNSGNWWKYAEESIPSSAFILSIILYSDVTTTDTLGKNLLHPIYLSLGNIPTWRRNKEDAKQLLEYFPILSAKNKTEKESSDFKKLARKTFHDSIKFLLDPLFQGDGGVDFNIDGKDVWFFSRISTIICDWPKACTFSLTYKSANSNYPCHFCLVQKEDLIDIRKD
ncbi:hypothetical protein Glove_571g8 [Diversispora epigaea]|uniref:Uncharacterized protein n=1 Tax=Diversispora epigaea TaxID=1348612 RepID=A0A397GCY7_9GLOM|nr:hypothetical protein Glove_571g8 [Diversispora epigaea]